MDKLILILLIILIFLLCAVLYLLISLKKADKPSEEASSSLHVIGNMLRNSQQDIGNLQSKQISEIGNELHRMNDSVSKRLEQMNRSVGEMYSLTADVNDLKKILSNVKTRGILGELQLRNILEDIMTKSQYEENCYPIPGSRNVVEFAIKLPGKYDEPVYLPIDSKFPATLYHHLCDAYDSGDTDEIDDAAKALVQRFMSEASDIRKKYIQPPYTTDFAVMFLPFEGLYYEAVRRGMIEELQKKYNVMLAGPSTMAAFLNALQTGFHTLAVEQKSTEVWNALKGIKTEFIRFSEVLKTAIKHTEMLEKDLRNLSDTRTSAILKKLDKLEINDKI